MIIGTTRKDNIPEKDRAKASKFGIDIRHNAELIKQGKDTNSLHLIVDMSRIGASLFSVKMEYTYFAPRSGKNALFNMVLMKWPSGDFSMMWAILSFPIEFRPQAEMLAQECGLRFADGVPHVFDNAGAHTFPLEGPTVFTLENMHNHQVYENDPATVENLKKEEFEAMDRIFKADHAKLRVELLDQGYSPAQVERIISHWSGGDEDYDEVPENKDKTIDDGAHRHKGSEK